MNAQKKTGQNIPVATWALASSSWILLFNIIGLATHVRLGLGHWPIPMLENYDTAAYKWHEHLCVGVVFFAVYAAIPLWLLSLCVPAFRLSRKTHLLQLGLYAAGWVVILILGTIDPGRFIEWFMD